MTLFKKKKGSFFLFPSSSKIFMNVFNKNEFPKSTYFYSDQCDGICLNDLFNIWPFTAMKVSLIE